MGGFDIRGPPNRGGGATDPMTPGVLRSIVAGGRGSVDSPACCGPAVIVLQGCGRRSCKPAVGVRDSDFDGRRQGPRMSGLSLRWG